MVTTWTGDGYSIEFLGIQPYLEQFQIPAVWGTTGPTARVTLEKSGQVTTLQWPWAWGSDDGFQNVMSMAKTFADKQIESDGL